MKNRIMYRLYKIYSVLLYALPLSVLFAINHKQYIKNAGTSLGFFGYIILMFVAIAFKSNLMNAAKKNTLLTVSLAVLIVSFLMRYLAAQMLLISGASVLGCLFMFITEPVADVYYDKSYKILTDGRRRKINAPPLPQHKAWSLAYRGEIANDG